MDWLTTLESTRAAAWLRESGSIWAYPTVLTLHPTGMAALVGANWALDLRILGVGGGVPLGALRTLFTAMWIGFWLNAVTGVMLFAADATTKGTTTVFVVKMALVALATIAAVLMKRSVYGATLEPVVVPAAARVLAVASIGLWIGAITAGRLMAYL